MADCDFNLAALHPAYPSSAERALKYVLVRVCRCVQALSVCRDINGLMILKSIVDGCLHSRYLLRWCCDSVATTEGEDVGMGKTKERMLLTVKAIEALKPEA
jgi:hypothetical protein